MDSSRKKINDLARRSQRVVSLVLGLVPVVGEDVQRREETLIPLIMPGWGLNVGIVLLARDDGKHLLTEHVEVLVSFCKSKVNPLVREARFPKLDSKTSTRAETLPIDKVALGTIAKVISEEDFRTYFAAYCAQRRDFDDKWQDIPSPYDV